MIDPKITLLANKMCPFCERAWLTIEEKKVPYSLMEMQLSKKSPFFTETYRKAYGNDPKSNGKVPILLDGDKVLTESDLISWYVAQKFDSGTQLIPKDPFEALKMRHFIASAGNQVTGGFYKFVGFQKKTKEEQEAIRANLDKVLQSFNDSLVLPYATGDNFSLADILVYPWFPRWCAISQNMGVELDAKFTRIHQWLQNVSQRDSAKKVRQPDSFYSSTFIHDFE